MAWQDQLMLLVVMLQHFLRVKFKSRKDARLLEGSLFQHIEELWAKHEGEIAGGRFNVGST
jgi:hypothetical protein